jgi:hypothetical protein
MHDLLSMKSTHKKKKIVLKNYIYIFESEVVTVFLNEFLKYFIFKN